MKKIIRLTESDLARIVRRVIKESGNEKVEKILKSIDNDSDQNYDEWDGTDENLLHKTVMSISDLSEYKMITNIIKEKTGKHLPYWINSEISDDVLQVGNCDKNGDRYKKIDMFCHITDLGAIGQSKWTKEKCKKFFDSCLKNDDIIQQDYTPFM